MKNLFKLILLFLSLGFIYSCAEEKPDCMKVPERIKENVADYLFNDSSFWIYENISTLEMDSQIVFKSHKYLRPTTKTPLNCQPAIADEWSYSVERHINGVVDSFAYLGVPVYKLYIKDRTTSLSLEVLNLDMASGQNTDSITYLQHHASLIIADSTYNGVSVFHVPTQVQPVAAFPYAMDLYFAPKVGLVRKVEYNTPNGTQIWDLIRYKTTPIPDNKYP